MMLEGEGLSVEAVANGKEALDAMARRRPSVILLDMRMPVMDGWQFCREMDQRGGRRPTLVVVTAAADPATRAAEVHADAWLSKPFDRSALLSLVQRLVVENSARPPDAADGVPPRTFGG
jgi:CheY-like chemotaxis protein